MEEVDIKCLEVMASEAEMSQRLDAQHWVVMEQPLEECLMAPSEYVASVLMEDCSED